MPPTYPVLSFSQDEVNDAILGAVSMADKDIELAQQAWQGNKQIENAKTIFSTLPPEAKELLKRQQPKEYADVMARLRID